MSAPALLRPVPLLPADAPVADWLAARRKGIGGSDVAAVIGVSKYAGPTRVYYDKLGVLPDGRSRLRRPHACEGSPAGTGRVTRCAARAGRHGGHAGGTLA